jgi:hypothetical protein
MAPEGLTPNLQKGGADIGILQPYRAVYIPGKSGPSRASAGLIIRHILSHPGIVRLLGFPDDYPILNVHVPGAGSGTVYTVRRADDLVKLPSPAIEILPPSFPAIDIQPGRDFFLFALHVPWPWP